MYDGGGMRVGRDQKQARKAAVAKATAWTEGQAARLGTNADCILEAVKRGWLPEDNEAAPNKYALEDDPTFSPIRFKIIREPKMNRRAA